MPVNLGLDTFCRGRDKALFGGRFRKRVEDLCEAAWKSDRNRFGSAAVLTAAEQTGLAPGQLIDFAGTVAPAGFLECNGTEVSRAVYADLFAAIGTTYGDAQSNANFKLPDFTGASATGAGGTYVAGPGVSRGSTHPTDTVTLVSGNMPEHAHAIDEQSDKGGGHTHQWTRYPPFGYQTRSIRDSGGSSEKGASGQNDQLDNVIDAIEQYTRDMQTGTGNWTRRARNFLEDQRNGNGLGTVAPFALGTPGISYSEPSEDATTGLAGAHTHAITGDIDDAGSGTALNVQQPSLAVMVLIKT